MIITDFKASIEDKSSWWIGAFSEDELIGVAQATMSGEVATIVNLCISDSSRRKGIATAIIKLAEKRAKEEGKKAIALTCQKDNLAALALYEKLGYEPGWDDDKTFWLRKSL